MYKEYFGLTEIPFSIAPDPRYLYLSEQHREALAHLLYGVNCDGGFVLLTGEVGTGKTTVCRCFLEQIPEHCDVAYILNPRLTVRELLSTICDEFSIKYPRSNKSIKIFVDLINGFLLDSHARGRKSILIIDEAQNLNQNVLEQIRLLTNLETHQRKLLQIILLGQPELRDMLELPAMRQLAQRIVARYHLGPLKKEEVLAYVNHRLAVAGLQNRVLPASIIAGVYRLSGGLPRLINVLCDRALLGAYVCGKERVDKAVLSKAAHEVFGEIKARKRSGRVYRWLQPSLALMMCVAAIAVLYSYKVIPLVTFKASTTDQGVIISTLLRKPIWAPAEGETPISPKPAVPHENKSDSVEPLAALELKARGAAAYDGSRRADGRNNGESAADNDKVLLQQTTAVALEQSSTEAGSKNTSTGSLKWPESQPISQSDALASEALFQLWGAAYTPNKSVWACDQAIAQGLRCLTGNGGLDELRKYNRPAVLKLFNAKGQIFYATLKALTDETATFIMGTETAVVGLHEIALHWRGDYMLLWRPPPKYSGPMGQGDTGPAVRWLCIQLARIRGESAEPPDKVVFDGAMVEDVKRFQVSAGLKPDGIVGIQTLIRLDSGIESGNPLLLNKKRDKG